MNYKKNNDAVKERQAVVILILALILTFVSQLAINSEYNLLYQKLWVFILTGVCFFIALSIKNRIYSYGLIIGISYFGLQIYDLMTISLHVTAPGAMVLFLLAAKAYKLTGEFINSIMLPSITGYLFSLLYVYLLNSLRISTTTRIIGTGLLAVIFIVVSLEAFSPYWTNVAFTKQFGKAINSKYHFAQQIAYAVNSGQIHEVNKSTIISHGIYKDFYALKDGSIIHEFGGMVLISQKGDQISITYENIPANKICADFYAINTIDTFGFSQILINGKPYIPSGTKLARLENCYTGEKFYDITFIGSKLEMKNLRSYLFDSLKKKEEVLPNENNFSSVFDINFSHDKVYNLR